MLFKFIYMLSKVSYTNSLAEHYFFILIADFRKFIRISLI
jgi:hypothetical protein